MQVMINMKKFLLLSLLPFTLFAQKPSPKEINDWEKQAQQIEIIRDKWGIAHVYGKTDADAVFGMLYAQCEDDFKRVELNYIEKLGRLAEIEGEKACITIFKLGCLLTALKQSTIIKSRAMAKKDTGSLR